MIFSIISATVMNHKVKGKEKEVETKKKDKAENKKVREDILNLFL
jgi:hypothetical protein